jgi:hypothetical protein
LNSSEIDELYQLKSEIPKLADYIQETALK